MTKNGKRGVGVAVAFIAVALLAYLFYSLRDAPAKLLDPDDRQLVQRGAEVYAKQCAACQSMCSTAPRSSDRLH